MRTDAIYNTNLFTRLGALALICVSASLILPSWSLQDSSNQGESVNIAPYGANYVTHSTNFIEYRFVTDLYGEGNIVVGLLLIMTLFTIFFLFQEYLYLKQDDGTKKYRRSNNYLYISGVLTILTPLTFTFLLSQELKVNGNSFSFWGSYYGYDGTIIGNCGPNVGWFLQIMAFILVTVVIINVRASNRGERSSVVRSSRIDPKTQDVNPFPLHSIQKHFNEPQKMLPDTMPKLFCGNCGRGIPVDANLCPYCATNIVINRGHSSQ